MYRSTDIQKIRR